MRIGYKGKKVLDKVYDFELSFKKVSSYEKKADNRTEFLEGNKIRGLERKNSVPKYRKTCEK